MGTLRRLNAVILDEVFTHLDVCDVLKMHTMSNYFEQFASYFYYKKYKKTRLAKRDDPEKFKLLVAHVQHLTIEFQHLQPKLMFRIINKWIGANNKLKVLRMNNIKHPKISIPPTSKLETLHLGEIFHYDYLRLIDYLRQVDIKRCLEQNAGTLKSVALDSIFSIRTEHCINSLPHNLKTLSICNLFNINILHWFKFINEFLTELKHLEIIIHQSINQLYNNSNNRQHLELLNIDNIPSFVTNIYAVAKIHNIPIKFANTKRLVLSIDTSNCLSDFMGVLESFKLCPNLMDLIVPMTNNTDNDGESHELYTIMGKLINFRNVKNIYFMCPRINNNISFAPANYIPNLLEFYGKNHTNIILNKFLLYATGLEILILRNIKIMVETKLEQNRFLQQILTIGFRGLRRKCIIRWDGITIMDISIRASLDYPANEVKWVEQIEDIPDFQKDYWQDAVLEDSYYENSYYMRKNVVMTKMCFTRNTL